MTGSDQLDATRAEQAAEWWAKFQECEPAAEDVAAWIAWMEQDDSNARAFHSMNELAMRIRYTRTVAPEQAMRLLPVPARRRAFAAKLAIAASVLAFVGIVASIAIGFAPRFGSDRDRAGRSAYATRTAAQREVLLPDGSRVVLGGASKIATNFTAERRVVRLSAGEAYFEVKHETSGRPFVVDAGIATVQAIGTAFNVRRNDRRVAVTVVEGRVRVDRVDGLLTKLAVAAGLEPQPVIEARRDERVVVEPSHVPLAVVAADPRSATSWQRGRLEFVDEPLDVVIENVGRYANRSLIAADPRLHSITYTGSFVPEHFDGWLGALQNVFPVQVTQEGDVTQIQVRPGTR